ncbi:MAG: VOC family protein [Chloroflexi bacterium]|nr:VOC family protein [Chloroflexota bacterium]
MDVERIDRIGMAVAELEPQVDLLEGLFGFTTKQRLRDDVAGVERVLMSVPGTPDIEWEVAAPTRAASCLQGFIDSPLGPGLHYVRMRVPSLSAAVEDLRAAGIGPRSEQAGTQEQPVEEVLIHGHGFQFRVRGPGGLEHRPNPPPAREGSVGITAIDHLAHAHGDCDELAAWYRRAFGMTSLDRFTTSEFVQVVMETPAGQLRWEAMHPADDASFVARFLERRGSAMHHIAFEVADWDAAVDACVAHGVQPFRESTGVTDDGARWMDGFIHPRQTGGVLVQFFWEERPGIWGRTG